MHLTDEALLAEDAAIRYADLHRGRRSGAFVGREAYHEIRDSCMAALFGTLADHHHVDAAAVRESVSDRHTIIDALILISFIAVYLAVSDAVLRWLSQTALFDLQGLRWAATSIAAFGAATTGVAAFGLYFGAVEMIRIGNTHISYRAWRHPWLEHKLEFLLGAVTLFVLLAIYRNARTANRASSTIEAKAG